MDHLKYILRALQTVTAIMCLVIVFLLLASFDIEPFASVIGHDEADTAIEENVEHLNKLPEKLDLPMVVDYKSAFENGVVSFEKGNLDAALVFFQKAAEKDPKSYVLYEKIGDIHFLKKNYDAAKRNFELAFQLNPGGGALQIKLIKSLLGLRDTVEARAQAEKIQPQTQESLYYRGLIAAFLGERDQAKNLLTESLGAGLDESLKTNAQKILTAFRDFELAAEGKIEFLQALLAQTFDQIGQYGLAIELGFTVLKTEPNYRDVWVILGHAFLNELKWNDAESYFSRAIALDTNHPSAYFFRAIAKKNLEKTQEAILDAQEALKLGWKPQVLAKQQLADLYFSLKNFAQAYELYKEVVRTDPSDIDRFIRPIALAVNHLKKPAEALELATQAYAAHENSAMGHNLLGWAYLATGDIENSRLHLEQARQIAPDMAAVYLNLGQLAEKEGGRDKAMRYYQAAENFAGKSGDESIRNTAVARYNYLVARDPGEQTSTVGSPAADARENLQLEVPQIEMPQNAPQTQFIPSLSLL